MWLRWYFSISNPHMGSWGARLDQDLQHNIRHGLDSEFHPSHTDILFDQSEPSSHYAHIGHIDLSSLHNELWVILFFTNWCRTTQYVHATQLLNIYTKLIKRWRELQITNDRYLFWQMLRELEKLLETTRFWHLCAYLGLPIFFALLAILRLPKFWWCYFFFQECQKYVVPQ